AAFDSPFLRSQSCAACMSPSVSVSAALQSIMPAPVDSRRSLTIAAVIVAIVGRPSACRYGGGQGANRPAAVPLSNLRSLKLWPERSGHHVALFRFRGQLLGLRNPGISAAR